MISRNLSCSLFGCHLLEEDLPDPAHGFDEDDAVGAAPGGEEGDDGSEPGCHFNEITIGFHKIQKNGLK